MKRVTVTMDKLPKSVLELKSEAEKMHSPEGTALTGRNSDSYHCSTLPVSGKS